MPPTLSLHRPATADPATQNPAELDPGHALSSVGKALLILDAFRGAGAVLGVSQIAERAQIPKSTAHRLLAILVEHGFVRKHEGRYMLGRSVFELGNMVSDARPRSLREISMPYMVDLYGSTNATVHLAVLDGDDVLYVEKIYGHRAVPLPSRVGGRVPALCTALGKAMLAHAPSDVRDSALSKPVPRMTPHTVISDTLLRSSFAHVHTHGYAEDHAGASLAARCIAAPIIDSRGRAVAAISISFPITSEIPRGATSELVRFATSIGQALS